MAIFGEKSEEKKRANELRNSIKSLKKRLMDAGMDKTSANKNVKELQEAIEEGARLNSGYQKAYASLERANRTIERLLEGMGLCGEEEIVRNIAQFTRDLHQVTHVCLLREDDADFISTRSYMESISRDSLRQPGALLMLRSELENLRAVFADAMGWQAPEFFALAYYLLHGPKEALGELENEQRNQMIANYLRDNFLLYFYKFCEQAGVKEEVTELIQDYIYGAVILQGP